MTCVLSSAWQPFRSAYEWSPMNQIEGSSISASYDRHQHGYMSSGSESKHTSNPSGKKRPSRAGTRSVTSLSAAQLERKRANDREAQRAIRQRTKEHIESLERSISDLRVSQDASEKLVAATQQRNRELEEENVYLRNKLNEAGYSVNIPVTETQQPAEQSMIPVHSASPTTQGSSVPRAESTSTPRSALSLATSQSSTSRHGSWQYSQSNVVPPPASALPNLAGPSPVQMPPSLTSWRSQDSSQSIQSAPSQLQESTQNQPPTPYSATNPNDRAQWPSTSQAYQYTEQPRPIKYEPAPQPPPPPQPQPQYVQAAVPAYTAAPSAAQQQAYHAPAPPPPQAEFQGMAVSSPTAYQMQQQQAFAQPPQYQMSPMEVPPQQANPAFASQQGQMPPQPSAAYHPAQGEQYAHHPPMAFRDESGGRSAYSLTHFPTG